MPDSRPKSDKATWVGKERPPKKLRKLLAVPPPSNFDFPKISTKRVFVLVQTFTLTRLISKFASLEPSRYIFQRKPTWNRTAESVYNIDLLMRSAVVRLPDFLPSHPENCPPWAPRPTCTALIYRFVNGSRKGPKGPH